jgi:hypothetical protein
MRTWKLETSNGGFTARWFHQAVVFNNRIWIFSGSPTPATSAFLDSWSSADGVTWQPESSSLQLPAYSVSLNVFVANGKMLAVAGGRIYSYSEATHAFIKETVNTFDLTGSTGNRSYASLTFYNNSWWYIGGRDLSSGNAMNDVWRSSNGITWTQMSTPPFTARYRHQSFVIGGKLWVFGGESSVGDDYGPSSNDAWSTTDGANWTNESANGVVRGYLMQVVQEPNKVTLIGGAQYGVASHVWQTTDGLNWSEVSAHAQFSPRISKGVAFNGQMWIVGGIAVDARTVDRDTNEIWRSSDGLNWSRVTPNGSIFSPRDGHAMIVYNNRLWVIGGQNNPTGVSGAIEKLNDVWSSADGVTWQQEIAAAAFTARSGHGTFVLNGKLWVIGGCISASICMNDVWSSNDGVNWVNESGGAAFSPRGLLVTTFNNALWIFSSETAAGLANDDAWRSTDGVTWTQQSLGTHYLPRTRIGLQVLNGRLYAIGGASDGSYVNGTRYNDVWSSADGLTWRQDLTNAPFSPRELHTVITHNNELWLIGGLDADLLNEVWRSSDSVNWRMGFSHDITAP